jgi:hypothetical protein
MFTDNRILGYFSQLIPFLNLMYPTMNEKCRRIGQCLQKSGFLPEWPAGTQGCMVGNNSASIVADAYLKG